MHIHVMKIIKKRKAKQRFFLFIRVFTLLGIPSVFLLLSFNVSKHLCVNKYYLFNEHSSLFA